MKYKIILLCLIGINFLKTSCTNYINFSKSKSEIPKYEYMINEDLRTFKLPNGSLFPNDKNVYKNSIKQGKSRTCAQLYSHCKSQIEQIRLRRNNTDFRHYKYQSCKAVKFNDTIRLSFRNAPIGGGDMIYFASIPIDIYIANSNFETVITHTSDAIQMVPKKGQENTPLEKLEYEQVPVPTSKIEYARLILNDNNYSIGDTISGDVYIKSNFAKKYYGHKPKDTTTDLEIEIVKGWFRVILEGEDNNCSIR